MNQNTVKLVDSIESLYIGGASIFEISIELNISTELVQSIITSYELKRHKTAKKRDEGHHYYSYIMKSFRSGKMTKQEKNRALNRFYRNRGEVDATTYEVVIPIKNKHNE